MSLSFNFQDELIFQIYSAFSRVGQINHFRLTLDPTYSVDHIPVISIKSSNIDELERQCEIIAIQFAFQIERKRRQEQDDNVAYKENADQSTLFAPPAQDSSNNILNTLNDDCLRTIFHMADMMGLTAIANTCTRFHSIAKEVFGTRRFEEYTELKSHDLWQVANFFRTFGAQITSLPLIWSGRDFLEIEIRLALEYCTKLTKLECSATYNHSRTALRRVLPQLKELVIHRAYGHISELFATDTIYQLEKLHFSYFLNLDLPMMQMPQLIDLSLQAEHDSAFHSYHFLSLNPQIEELRLHIAHYSDIDCNRILRLLPNIQKLIISDDSCATDEQLDVTTIVQLQHLHTLHICIEDFDTKRILIASLIQAMQGANKRLDSLILDFWYGGVASMIIGTIFQMKSITTLKILDANVEIRVNDACMGQLIDNLDQLECIHVENLASLSGISDALQTAPRLKTAHFQVLHPLHNEQILESKIAEIDAIRQQKDIDLHISIQLSNVYGTMVAEVSAFYFNLCKTCIMRATTISFDTHFLLFYFYWTGRGTHAKTSISHASALVNICFGLSRIIINIIILRMAKTLFFFRTIAKIIGNLNK